MHVLDGTSLSPRTREVGICMLLCAAYTLVGQATMWDMLPCRTIYLLGDSEVRGAVISDSLQCPFTFAWVKRGGVCGG